MHGAGAEVMSLDFEAAALYRAHGSRPDVRVILDVGASRSQVVIGRGGTVRLVKSIAVGCQTLDQALSRKLGITLDDARQLRHRLGNGGGPERRPSDTVARAAAEASRNAVETLGREVEQCLRYYAVAFRGPRPARVTLVGGGASDSQLATALGGVLSVPVERGDVFDGITIAGTGASAVGSPGGEWATAFGLAIKLAPPDMDRAASQGSPSQSTSVPIPAPVLAQEVARA
jgi:Tfp pilus assembly PilM family ATPase